MRRLFVLLALAGVAATSPLVAQATAAGYAAADAHADATPAAAEQSVAALAAWLAQAGADELTRARAVYRWVTGRIDYDANGFRSGVYGDLTPEGVLRRRTGVCQGYAVLMQALGAAMGLQVEIVGGWSKGYGYRPGQTFEGRTNHAWNAVRIDGQWRLMDPTWGAGYLDQQMQFVRRFQDHYFLTSPDAFIFDHLPEDARWQLLERPITPAAYADLAYLRPMFFVSGLRIGSHPVARITTVGRLLVTLGATQPVSLSAVVVDAATNRNVEGDWALAQMNGDAAEIRAAFPRPGQYVLRVFARARGAETPAQWALDYQIEAREASEAGFPLAYRGFAATGAYLVEPLTGALRVGQSYRFRLRAPGAIDVAIVAGGQWTHFTRAGEEFTAELPAVAGTITVYAKYAADAQHTGLLRYMGR